MTGQPRDKFVRSIMIPQATTPWIIGRPHVIGVAWTYREATAREAAKALQDRSRHVRVMLGRPWEKEDKESPQ